MATSATSYLPGTYIRTTEIFQPTASSSQADFQRWEGEWKQIYQPAATSSQSDFDKWEKEMQQIDSSSGTNASSAGISLNSGLISSLLPILSALISWISEAMSSAGGSGGGTAGGNGMQPVNYSAPNDRGSHAPIGPGGNPADIAEKLEGRSADSIVRNQDVKMDHGVSDHVDCANFASAVLVKAGLIPQSQHTNSVATLKSELLHKDGWHEVSKSHAKRGDVCIVGGDQHVEIVDHVDKNGNIVLIGSNNVLRDGSQAVCKDSSTCNRRSVEILST